MKNINLFINSPLEQFEVLNLISINAPLFGYLNISVTNLGFYSILVVTLIVIIQYMWNNNNKLIPSKGSILLESIFSTLNTLVKEQIGREIYLPFIYSLFIFILFSNLVGNVPYSYTITTSVIVTLGLSFTILTGVTILSLYIHKIKFFSYFVPSGTPLPLVPLLVLIEVISY